MTKAGTVAYLEVGQQPYALTIGGMKPLYGATLKANKRHQLQVPLHVRPAVAGAGAATRFCTF